MKRCKSIIGLLRGVMAQDASAFVDQDLIYDFLLAQHRLPSIEDLDFLNAEELKTLYEWLLQMYSSIF